MEKGESYSEPIILEQANQDAEKADALPHSRKLRGFLAGIALLGAIGAGIGITNCNSNNGNSHPKEVPAHFFNGAEGCDNSTETSVQYPGNPTEIIPQKANDQQLNNLSDNNSAAKYLEGLFSKKGPMGENYDPAVMSTFWALIGYPATSDGYQTKERILGTFRSSYNQMTTNNDQFNNLSANKFCKINEKVMSQTFDYEDVAIARGTLITQIDALTKNGKIDNISLKSFNAKEDVSGIVFKIKNKNTDNGFITVVIDKQGNILVTGIQPTAGGSSTTNKSKLNKSKSNHQSPEPISGGGGVTSNGPVQENLPGNSSGNSTGTSNTGNQKESTTGTGSTPSGGRTTTTTKPPTTTVPKSPPTTTIPPTTTTTSPTKKNPDPNPGGCTDPFDPTCQGT